MIVSINHKVFSLRDIQLWPDQEVEMLSNSDPLDLCVDRYCGLLSGLLPPEQGRGPSPPGHNGRKNGWIH